jgi:hypothetical protein
MQLIQRTISRFCKDHRQVMLVMAAVTWSLLMPLIGGALAAEPLKVGGLPVT